jgi:hypothetical protein
LKGFEDNLKIIGRIRHETLPGSSFATEKPRSGLMLQDYRARSGFAQHQKANITSRQNVIDAQCTQKFKGK